MKNTYTIEIDAPPERVFYWLDDDARLMQWLPNLIENAVVEATPNRVGSTFRQVYLENGRRMEMHGVVTAYEPDRRIASDIRGDLFDLAVDYRLEDRGGRTRLTQDSEIRFKGLMKLLGALMTPFMKKSSQKQLDASLGKLKRLAETP